MKYLMINRLLFVVVIVALFASSGCAVRYVADYDASIKEEIFQVAKKVDIFWGVLLDTDKAERPYDKFKEQYNQIEADLRVLVMKNEIRALNKESTKQANIALSLWVEDRQIHKKEDSFSNSEAQRHRKQFHRVFTAMASGEDIKKNAK